MIDKIFASTAAALADVPDGATVMIGGFGTGPLTAARGGGAASRRSRGVRTVLHLLRTPSDSQRPAAVLA